MHNPSGSAHADPPPFTHGRQGLFLYYALSFVPYSCHNSGDPSVSLAADSVSLRLGHGAALTCYQHVIHYRAAASLPKRGAKVCPAVHFTRGTALDCSYAAAEKLKQEITAFGGIVAGLDYGAAVTIHAYIPEESAEDFKARIFDVSAGGVTVCVTGEDFRAVPQVK